MPLSGASAAFMAPLAAAVHADTPEVLPVPDADAPEGATLAAPGLVRPADALSAVSPDLQHAYGGHSAQRAFDGLLAGRAEAADDPAAVRDLARLHSCACRPASIWLDTLPTSRTLRISDSDFRASLQHRLGLYVGPVAWQSDPCFCKRSSARPDHALVCTAVSDKTVLRHDTIRDTWRRVVRRAGVSSASEPRLQGLGRVPTAAVDAPGDRGDLVAALPTGDVVADVSVIHPCADTYVRAGASGPGGAAAVRERQKNRDYGFPGNRQLYDFVPLVSESFGRLGSAAMRWLTQLAGIAADRLPGSADYHRAAFVESALRELAVALCRGVGRAYRASLQVRVRAAGSHFMRGLPEPSTEVSEE